MKTIKTYWLLFVVFVLFVLWAIGPILLALNWHCRQSRAMPVNSTTNIVAALTNITSGNGWETTNYGRNK